MNSKEPFSAKRLFLPVVIIVVLVVLVVLGPFAVSCIYLWTRDAESLISVFTASDLILFYGAALTFVGTVLLGFLALWQNIKLNKINEKLQADNNYFQETMTQKLLPAVVISDISTESESSTSSLFGHEKTPAEHFRIVHQYRDNQLNETIRLNVDIDLDEDKSSELYCKQVSFKLVNVSEVIIRHIAFDKIVICEVKMPNGDKREKVTCLNQGSAGSGISTFLNEKSEVEMSLFVHFKNKILKNFCEDPRGCLPLTIYFTCTSLTGMRFKQVVQVEVSESRMDKCAYGQWD